MAISEKKSVGWMIKSPFPALTLPAVHTSLNVMDVTQPLTQRFPENHDGLVKMVINVLRSISIDLKVTWMCLNHVI